MPKTFKDSEIESFRKGFSVYDVEGEGLVSFEDLGSLLRSFQLNLAEDELEEVIVDLNIDQDEEGVISFSDFVQIMANKKKDDSPPPQPKNVIQRQEDFIDRIVKLRVKKIAIPTPAAPMRPSQRLNHVFITESDMFHIMHEMKGTRFGPPSRPDLSLLIIGCPPLAVTQPQHTEPLPLDLPAVSDLKQIGGGLSDIGKPISCLDSPSSAASSRKKKLRRMKKPAAKSRERGEVVKQKAKEEPLVTYVEVVFDPAKVLFVLSERIVDKLLAISARDAALASTVHEVRWSCAGQGAMLASGWVDETLRRVWRRFLRLYVEPLTRDEGRMAMVAQRARDFAVLERLDQEDTAIFRAAEFERQKEIAAIIAEETEKARIRQVRELEEATLAAAAARAAEEGLSSSM